MFYLLDAITLAGNTDQVRKEIDELKRFALQAQTVEDSGAEAKLSRLKQILEEERFLYVGA